MQSKNVVIGIGNLLFKDDGIGVIAIEYLKKNFEFTPELELLDGGTMGFDLAQYFLEYDNVLIIDTISVDDKAGEIYIISSSELLGGTNYKNTAHEVEVIQMLEACELYDKKAEVTIIGIIPQDIQSVQIGLSEVLDNKFDILIKNIIKEIKNLKVNTYRKNNFTQSEILKSLQRV